MRCQCGLEAKRAEEGAFAVQVCSALVWAISFGWANMSGWKGSVIDQLLGMFRRE